MSQQRTTRIWPDTIKQSICNADVCRRTVYFAQNVKTGNFMIFDVRPTPVAEEFELGTNRPLWLIDLSKTVTHFASCKSARDFRRAR